MGIRRQLLMTISQFAPTFWANQLKNPIFLVGMARSGTSILNNLLSHHRDIAVLSEANDLWDPTGYPWNQSTHESPPVWVDHQAYTARWWRATQSRQLEVKAAFGLYQALYRTSHFLNKSPMNTYRLNYLLEMFPDAKFIYIMRDGRAVAQSYARKVFKKVAAIPTPYERYQITTESGIRARIGHFWQEHLDLMQQFEASYQLTDHNRLLKVTYEALCDDPRHVLAEICSFLNLSVEAFDASVWDIELKNQNHKWQPLWDEATVHELTSAMSRGLSDNDYLMPQP